MRSLEEAFRIGGPLITSHIPFVNFSGDWPAARSIYPNAELYRLALQSVPRTASIPASVATWVDAGVDALHNWPFANNESYGNYFNGIKNAALIADQNFQERPERAVVASFVGSVLASAQARAPSLKWLSVPQLPYVDGSGRNKINKLLVVIW